MVTMLKDRCAHSLQAVVIKPILVNSIFATLKVQTTQLHLVRKSVYMHAIHT